MKSSILFLSLFFFNHISGTFQNCDSGFNLDHTNITANVERADIFNTNYSNPEYVAMFQKDKAFCVIPHNSFYIQIDFQKIVTITSIKVQGFLLNQESLLMSAFSLEFSIDGKKWYEYNYKTGAKYLLVVTKFGLDNGNSVMHHQLENPIATRFMRLLPQQPTKSSSEKICLRLKVFGCEKVFPPKVNTPREVRAVISGVTTLSCNAVGTFGLSLGWDKNDMTSRPNPEKLYTVVGRVVQDVEVSLSDLDQFDCQVHRLFLMCKKQFTCYGSYYFKKEVLVESHTTMMLEVHFPSQPQSFQVKSRKSDSVTIAWDTPHLKSLTIDMLEYVIKCSHDINNETEEILAMDVKEKTIYGLGVYKPYWCSLKVQLKNSNFKQFPYNFTQTPIVLDFYSSTIRPNITPKMKLQVHSPTHINITIPPVFFNNKEYGVLSGFLIKAVILQYGGREPVIYFANEKLSITKRIDKPNLRQYTLQNIIPWSIYRVSLSVYNNDGFTSNETTGDIHMPEGVPSKGVGLLALSVNKNRLVVQTSHFNIYYRHGIITEYELVINPGGPSNRTITQAGEFFEIPDLKPYTVYTMRCKAATKMGFGPYGALFSLRTAEDKPSAPLDVHLVGDINSVKKDWHVVWTKPKYPNGNITVYSVDIELKNGSTVKYLTTHEVYHVRDTPKDVVKKIHVRASTSLGWGPRSEPYYPTAGKVDPRTQDLNNVILVVAVVFAVVFLLILIGLCIMLYRRRATTLCVKDPTIMEPIVQRASTSSAHVDDDDANFGEMGLLLRNRSDSNGTGNNSLNTTREPIKVEDFVAYIDTVKKDEYGSLVEEFTSVSSGKCSPCQVAELPSNREKNRYADIRPYDHSRVVLKTGSGRKSDFINASYVQGFNYEMSGNCRYISAQGPLDNTQDDFWCMIWQKEASVIVMLTNLIENSKPKCSQYWPAESAEYGDLTVTLEKIDKTADYVTRYLKIEKKSTEEVRSVLQFHFVSWPDHGVPDYPTAILSLRRRIRHSYDVSKPMVVHCSAGVGRSGCFILIDAMLERIDQEKTVDVYNYLRYMRTRRINMVQTFEQYRLAHTAILEYITFGNTEIFVGELDKRIRQLSKNTGMAEEFELLTNNTTPVPSTGNPYQVLLREKFIDAYYIDGYKQRDGFIITKAATKENVGDFWKMVLDKQCHTIVMLNKCQEPTQEFYKYWPDVENHYVYEDTTVFTTSEVANGNIITRKIKVTTNKRKCEVYHFQYVDWPSADIPHRRGYTNICTLMQAVEKSQQNLGNGPIIVHGGDGYGRSGSFISIYNSTERLKVEQLIDVLQCVRAIRISQPLAVDNITQYQFVYNMLRTYLEGFENYWNYKDYKATRSPLNSTST